MLSQTVEYALRAVVYLSRQGDKPQTIQQIAGPTQIPPGYLAKVLLGLARNGILSSQRGFGGGFVLAIPADKLTMYDVVQAVDPIPRIHKCPLDNPDHALELCDLHKRLDQAAQYVENNFKEVTIAEVATKTVFTHEAPAPPSGKD
jgi:Rrf2 family protein